MLHLVPELRAQGEFIQARDMPGDVASYERKQTNEGMGKKPSARRWSAVEAKKGLSPYCNTGRGSPRRSGRVGAPSQRSGGTTIIRSRCWIIWHSTAVRRTHAEAMSAPETA